MENFENLMKTYMNNNNNININKEDILSFLNHNSSGQIQNISNFQRKSREEYLTIHNLSIEARKEQIKSYDDNIQIDSPMDLDTYNPLGKNIENNFEEVTIKQLELNKVNKNKYLILKIISKIFIINSTNFMGEDKNKDVINTSVYNSEKYFGIKEWDKLEKDIYTEGKYVIFIEPYYKIYKSGSDGLRAESPNEIIILKDEQELNYFLDKNKNKTAENCKLLGNLMIKNMFYEKAIFYYKEGINLNKNDDNLDIILHSNLSEAYLKYKYFTKAIKNSDYCLDKINNLLKVESENNKFLIQQKTKALYRKIKGLVSLRKFKESYDILFNISKDNPNKDIMEEFLKLEQIKKMIDIIISGNNNYYGRFNYKKMLEEEKINFDLQNYSDYLSPKLEINYEKGKGVKITAKENIKQGELLFVEKSLVYSNKRGKKRQIFDEIMNVSIINPSKVAEVELFNNLAEKLLKAPLDNEKFYYLYDGQNLREDMNQRKKYLDDQENGKIKLKKEKINGVICNNKYGIGRYIIYHNEKCSGVWGYPSFINHDCLANTTYFGIGDYYISFSIKEIKKGEEITSNYCSATYTYEDRNNILLKNWGFKCSCQLCKYQEKRNEPDYNNFIKLLTGITSEETINKISLGTLKFFEEFLEKYKKNFSCYELANGYLQLESFYTFHNDLTNVKKFSELVTKYAGEKNYIFQMSNLYTLAICINNCNARDNGIYGRDLFIVMRDIQSLLKKYTPFTDEEIKFFIDDNIKQRDIDNAEKKKLMNETLNFSF